MKMQSSLSYHLSLKKKIFLYGEVGLPWWFSAGDAGSIPGLGRSPGEGNGNPLQYSPLGNPLDRGACQVRVHGVANELDMT